MGVKLIDLDPDDIVTSLTLVDPDNDNNDNGDSEENHQND